MGSSEYGSLSIPSSQMQFPFPVNLFALPVTFPVSSSFPLKNTMGLLGRKLSLVFFLITIGHISNAQEATVDAIIAREMNDRQIRVYNWPLCTMVTLYCSSPMVMPIFRIQSAFEMKLSLQSTPAQRRSRVLPLCNSWKRVS